MAVTATFSGTTGNSFLDSLSASSISALAPHLERMHAPVGLSIATAGLPITRLTFPVRSVVSTVATMRDGVSIEVSLIGHEGFHGFTALLGDGLNSNDAMVQVPDSMLQLPLGAFLEAVHGDPSLMRRALTYVQATLVTVGQLAGCNGLHQIGNRAARWLLMAHDRVDGDTVPLTHEFLAVMLGVRRPGVSLAAASLERAGLIEYRRGRITIMNRPALEAAACECYAVINDQSSRLLGYDIRKGSPRAA